MSTLTTLHGSRKSGVKRSSKLLLTKSKPPYFLSVVVLFYLVFYIFLYIFNIFYLSFIFFYFAKFYLQVNDYNRKEKEC